MARYLCTVGESLEVKNGGVCLILPRSFAYLFGRRLVELRRPDGRSTRAEMEGFISFFTSNIGFAIRTDEKVQAGTEVWLANPEGRDCGVTHDMPPNELCPACGKRIPDWHREWYTPEDQAKIFHGKAGLDCPLCGEVVIHAQWLTPLKLPDPGAPIERVKRDAIRAAYWAGNVQGGSLHDYLQTNEGQPYASSWPSAEVQAADQYVQQNPLQP